MKAILLVLFIANIQTLFCQNLSKLTPIKEFDYCYCDSANNEFVYGNYEPKDMLKLSDGSLLIGTEFSISFPSMLNDNTPDSVSFKLLEEKFHISSGSVFKLDSGAFHGFTYVYYLL